MREIQISGKEFEKIIVTTKEGEVVIVISDNKIIEYKGYKVILDPASSK